MASVMPLAGTAHAEPAYAKWGRVAVEQTSKKYQAEIVDYRYDGRRVISSSEAEERFKLIVRKSGREFGVQVAVRVNSRSNELIQVNYQETDA